ncbi:hypothetical protein CGMCC3_g5479 [Colletotrichum fructicola]|nr:uncharacterized protein CGMCC3_g5479 [Colletotrichum fructicola]KAE9578253.1 hypothetical protein CGMCC3_g5479 [Colletotrichum fructicola]
MTESIAVKNSSTRGAKGTIHGAPLNRRHSYTIKHLTRASSSQRSLRLAAAKESEDDEDQERRHLGR